MCVTAVCRSVSQKKKKSLGRAKDESSQKAFLLIFVLLEESKCHPVVIKLLPAAAKTDIFSSSTARLPPAGAFMCGMRQNDITFLWRMHKTANLWLNHNFKAQLHKQTNINALKVKCINGLNMTFHEKKKSN